jgi:hypothetical protein
MRQSIITFSSTRYRSSALLQANLCKLLGFYHYSYTEVDLPDGLLDYASNNPRGFGYWKWKPYLILEHFSKCCQDQIFWWVDAACVPLLLKSCLPNDFESLYLQKNIFSEPRRWCKNDFLGLTELDAKEFFSNGFIPDASIIGVRVNPISQQYISQWYNLCINNSAISDEIYREQSPGYRGHRHDQALLGIISWSNSIEQRPSLTQYSDQEWYFYHHRRLLSSPYHLSRFLFDYVLISFMAAISYCPSTVQLPRRLLY